MNAYELWFCGECYQQHDYYSEAQQCCREVDE